MNRQQRRAERHETKQRAKELPQKLTELPREEWPVHRSKEPTHVFISKRFLVQMYDEDSMDVPGLVRLSVCRSVRNSGGRWEDGITWDELYAIKRDLGMQDWYGVEVYPREEDLVNVSNMRHLWLVPYPLNIGWFAGGKS